LKGKCLEKLLKSNEAKEVYKFALELESNNKTLISLLDKLNKRIEESKNNKDKANEFYKNKNFKEALNYYNKSIEFDETE
jgi:tetratricopeptide (TPR) repeat protein